MTIFRLQRARLPLLLTGLLALTACNEAAPPLDSKTTATIDSIKDASEASDAAFAADSDDPQTAKSADAKAAVVDNRSKPQMSPPAFTTPTCDEFETELAKGNSPDEAFEKLMPAILVGDGVNDIAISDADMKKLTGFLACSAAAMEWDAAVPDAAGNLFSSPRHKAAALAALDANAKGTDEKADNARKFAEQMRAYNFGPNG